MSIKPLLVSLGLVGLLLGSPLVRAQSTTPEPGGEKAHDPALADVPDTPGLPRVLIIGDSISLGYTQPLRKLLEGKANVHRVGENAGPTSLGLQHLTEWLATGNQPGEPPKKWAVIHFNFGLHDIKILGQNASGPVHEVPADQYEKNLRELVARLKATGAKLIWASTTPVPNGPQRPMRLESDVLAYNDIAARVMKENGIPTDDLFALALSKESAIQRKNNVHLSNAGYQLLAAQAAAAIEQALNNP